MITIESDRTASAIQAIATEVLGYQPGVTQAGRLGNEITFESLDGDVLETLVAALREGNHDAYVTVPGLRAVELAARTMAEMRGALAGAEASLQDAVASALTDGVRAVDIAAVLGVTRARVYQIRDGRR